MQENNLIPESREPSPPQANSGPQSPPSPAPTPQLPTVSPPMSTPSSLKRGSSSVTEEQQHHPNDGHNSTTTSPRNCHSAAVITPTRAVSRGSGGSGVGIGPGIGGVDSHHHHQTQRGSGSGSGLGFANLNRSSSSESISDSGVYNVPIKYRSGVGSFEEHVAAGFSNLFASSDLSDVTIACEGKLIKAHKIVLAISSPYFRQIFEELHDFPCQHPVVILHGVKLKDWENIMRLIYCGIVHVGSTEIEDFISTAECLRIDGLEAEDPNGSSQEDPRTTPPFDYCSRLSSSEFHSPDSGGGMGYENAHPIDRRRSFVAFSPEDFSTAKDYRFDRSGGHGGHSPDPHQTGSGSTRNEEIDHLQQQSLLIRCQRSLQQGQGSRPDGVRVISSAQSSPGVGTHHSAVSRESLLKVEVNDNYGHGDSSHSHDSLPRPPSCPEGLRVYSAQSNSGNESRVNAVRHPVISRRRDPSSEFTEDSFEVQQSTGCTPSPRMALSARNLRPSPYPSGWEPRGLNVASDAVVIDEVEHQFPTVISGHRSPLIAPATSSSTGHGVTTRYPLSVISRQSPSSASLPFQQLLSPAVAAGFLNRLPHQLHLLAQQQSQQQRSPVGDPSIITGTSGGGVITSVASPHSSPQGQGHDPHHHPQLHPQSTLAMLREKIATGQQVYSRGCRADRQTLNHPFHPGARLPSAALGSASQLSPPEGGVGAGQGHSRSFVPSSTIAHLHQQQQQAQMQLQQGMARPKTKAIRSSQVPQSARYTAAEVDAMVDKVQNFPGNMVPCAICSKFVKRERLRAHIHECHLLHGKRIVCPHCGIGLKSKGSYRVHIWRHKKGALPSSRHRNSDPHQLSHQLSHQTHPGSHNPH